MSVLRPYRLERELDSAFYHWLAWLPQWRPDDARPRTVPCEVCPRYADALGLEELPHSALHGLFAGAERLVVSQFDREVDALYPRLREEGEWIIGVDRGVVRVMTSAGDSLDTLLEREEVGILEIRPTLVGADEAADARIVLIRSYWSLFEAAIARLGLQKSLVLRAMAAHVEPKIRSLADELVEEICRVA